MNSHSHSVPTQNSNINLRTMANEQTGSMVAPGEPVGVPRSNSWAIIGGILSIIVSLLFLFFIFWAIGKGWKAGTR